jgi:hypothetical protein
MTGIQRILNRRHKVMGSFQRQVQIRSLPAFSIHRKPRLKETDLNEIVRTVNDALQEYMHADTVAAVLYYEDWQR